MAYVASKFLGGGSFFDASSHVVYTVPLQRRTILKGIQIRSSAAAAQTLGITVKASGITTTASMIFHLAAAGSVGDTIIQDIWLVCDTAATITITFSNASGGTVSLSGAELEL